MQAQPGAEATAIESKPAAPFGTLSVTVTGVPSVAIVPTFETVSVNVVVAPATNCGECDLVRVRSGASTVVTTCGVVAVSAVARVCERNWAVAWLVIWVPTGSPPLIVTSKLNEVLFPGRPDAASNPPRVALASLAEAENHLVLGRVEGGDVVAGGICRAGRGTRARHEPQRVRARRSLPAGITSVARKSRAPSWPLFVKPTV